MTTNARWIVGLLLALVIGLGVALLIVAGDDSDDSSSTVTESATQGILTGVTEQTQTTETTETTETQPPLTDSGSGGVSPP